MPRRLALPAVLVGVGLVEGAWILYARATALLAGDAVPCLVRLLAAAVAGPLAWGALAWVPGWALGRVPRLARAGAVLRRIGGALPWTFLPCAALVATLPSLPRDWGAPLLVGGGSLVLALAALRFRFLLPFGALAAVALLPVRLPAPAPLPTPARTPGSGPLVLVTLDTFRADHLGALGGGRWHVPTPHLDALAREGILFSHGVAEVPLTLPSHTALLTGAPAWRAGVLHNGDRAAAGTRTVAHALREAGWTTGAFVSSRVLDGQLGLAAGFHHYDDLFSPWDCACLGSAAQALVRSDLLGRRPSERRGDVTVDRALTWLRRQHGRSFLWLHLYDPHAPYAPPPPWDRAFDASRPDAPGNPEEVARERANQRRKVVDLAGHDVRRQVAAYAGEIAWTDAVVGRLLDGLPAGSPVVVVADHGESLTEHGDFLNHGTSLYEPAIRVPVVVRAPAGILRVVDAPVSILRVAPTLRFLGGLPPGAPTLLDPPGDAWIQSWAPTQRSRVALELQSAWRVGWRQGPVKWIVDAHGHVERHDLDADPEERTDSSAGDPETDRMRERGRALLEDLRNADRAAVPEAVDGVREALEALGYAEPAAAP